MVKRESAVSKQFPMTKCGRQRGQASGQEKRWPALKAADNQVDDLEQRIRRDDSSIYVIEYRDGSRAVCCMLNGVTDQMSVAIEFDKRKQLLGQLFKMEMQYPYRHFETTCPRNR